MWLIFLRLPAHRVVSDTAQLHWRRAIFVQMWGEECNLEWEDKFAKGLAWSTTFLQHLETLFASSNLARIFCRLCFLYFSSDSRQPTAVQHKTANRRWQFVIDDVVLPKVFLPTIPITLLASIKKLCANSQWSCCLHRLHTVCSSFPHPCMWGVLPGHVLPGCQ